MLTNDNNVRRNDLSLRLKYIGIKTRIFKIAPFKYVILCSNIPDDFEKIKTYFDRSIRYVTLQISLSDQVPEHYIEELSPIDMEHPVDDFRATARTRAEIEEYIYGRYHDFDIRKIVPNEGGINFHMDIYVGSDVSDKQIARLQKELTEVRGNRGSTHLFSSDGHPLPCSAEKFCKRNCGGCQRIRRHAGYRGFSGFQ